MSQIADCILLQWLSAQSFESVQSAQPQTAGQLAESLIQQDSIPDNGKFPAFNMATRLNNLNAGELPNIETFESPLAMF